MDHAMQQVPRKAALWSLLRIAIPDYRSWDLILSHRPRHPGWAAGGVGPQMRKPLRAGRVDDVWGSPGASVAGQSMGAGSCQQRVRRVCSRSRFLGYCVR